MKVTVRNRQLLALLADQKERLRKLQADAVDVLARHTAEPSRPCAGGVCHAEMRLKNFVQSCELKTRYLDAEALRIAGKLWPWTRLSAAAWMNYIGDAHLESAVIVDFAAALPGILDPSGLLDQIRGVN